MNTSVNICGVNFKNPVTTASGTCGFGRDFLNFYKPEQLGAIVVKGLTLAPRLGNPPVRIAETPAGMLNSIGLQNPGVEKFIAEELPWLKERNATVIANIAGSCIDDYCEMARILSDTSVDMIEMNISCPNVKEGGVAFGTNPATVEKITSSVKKVCTKPLIVKLSPNVTDITQTAHAAEVGGADCLSLINTLLGMRIDIKTKRPVLHNNVGALSGPAVKPVAVRMVWQVRKVTDLPIIGMGGIASWEDAVEFLMAGANAVSIGCAAFSNPSVPLEVIDGIEKYMEANNISDISEITGSVIPY
ncbi:MAG: dihydroorotate dehydrogenase [Ruminococcaceae bacterium]|nr:dihydroorotate dehydrogenase [Oscillospiraceae bacterium]